jgi:hypothetical protein
MESAFASGAIGSTVELESAVRKAVFIFFLALGIAAGALATRGDDWGLSAVTMAVRDLERPARLGSRRVVIDLLGAFESSASSVSNAALSDPSRQRRASR